MAIFLEVISGNDLGLKFLAKVGLKIGRSVGEIQLNDPRLSALHAQIRNSDKGRLFLIDRASSNGIKVNGKRVDKVLLTPGASFQIGSTVFIVLKEGEEAAEKSLTESKSFLKTTDLQKTVIDHISHLKLTNKVGRWPVRLFNQAISLRFIEGFQKDQEVQISYGPRNFGMACLDFFIADPESPEKAFTIYSDESGEPVFITEHADEVTINGTSSPTEKLQNGDVIRVGSALIEVRTRNDESNSGY